MSDRMSVVLPQPLGPITTTMNGGGESDTRFTFGFPAARQTVTAHGARGGEKRRALRHKERY